MSSDERQDSLAAQAAAWVPPWERAPRTPDREFQAAAEAEARASQEDAAEAHAPGDSGPAVGAPGDDESIDEAGLSEDDDDFDPAFEGPNPSGGVPGEEEESPGGVTAGSGGSVAELDERGPAVGGSTSEGVTSAASDGAAGAAEKPAVGEPGAANAGVDVAAEEIAPGERAGVDAVAAPGERAGVEAAAEGAAPGDQSAGVDAAIEEPALGEPGDEDAGVDAAVGQLERESVDVAPGPELAVPESIEAAVEAADIDEPGTPVDAPLPPDGDDAGDVFDAAADDDVSDDGEMDLPFAEEVPPSDTDYEDDDEGNSYEDDSAAASAAVGGVVGDAAATAADRDAAAGVVGSDAAIAADGDASAGVVGGSATTAVGGSATTAVGGAADTGVVGGSAAAGGAAAGVVGASPTAADGDAVGGDPAAVEGGSAVERGAAAGVEGGAVAGGGGAAVSEAGGAGRAARGRRSAAVPGQKRRAGEPLGTESEPTLRTEEIDLPGLTDDSELAGALEAIMLVVDEPVAELQLAQILEQPTERIALMLDNLSARYTAAGHGFDLRRVAGGWRLYTRPEYAAYVERFVLDGQSVRLTQAALETLAVVAYKQPVTRSRISAIRGVNCDGVMRTLATRGLIEECGTESETGAHLYRTTGLFLEKLGLNSVDQLPPLAPFLPDDVEEVLDATG